MVKSVNGVLRSIIPGLPMGPLQSLLHLFRHTRSHGDAGMNEPSSTLLRRKQLKLAGYVDYEFMVVQLHQQLPVT